MNEASPVGDARPARGALAGARILITRGARAGERDAAAIVAAGGEPVHAPLTVIAPPAVPEALVAAATAWNSGEYNWVVITSANAADAFVGAGAHAPEETPIGRERRVAAVGPVTADALRGHGWAVDLVPETDFSGVGLAAALLERLGASRPGGSAARVLLPVSEIADRVIETELSTAGCAVERVTAYRVVAAPDDPAIRRRLADGEIDVILVLSGSAARELARRFPTLSLQHHTPLAPSDTRAAARPLLAAIGAPTARTLAELGIAADIIADPHTVSNLLARVAHALERPSTHSGGTPA